VSLPPLLVVPHMLSILWSFGYFSWVSNESFSNI
jgi:hypothetical protein